MKTLSLGLTQLQAIEKCLSIGSFNWRKYGMPETQYDLINRLLVRVRGLLNTEEVYLETEDIYQTMRTSRHRFNFDTSDHTQIIKVHKRVVKTIEYENLITGERVTYEDVLTDAGMQCTQSALLVKLGELSSPDEITTDNYEDAR